MRRALEAAPELYDGGVDWEGTYVDPVAPNILSGLPPATLNFPDYTASDFSPTSTTAQNAFDLLVKSVEQGAQLPPDQCIPRGGAIATNPAEPGRSASFFAP